MKEIIPFTMALNTEETPMGAVPSGRKTLNPTMPMTISGRLIDHFIAAVKDLPILTTSCK